MGYNYEDIGMSDLFNGMLEAMQAGMAAGFKGNKSIDGKTPEEWITDYIKENHDETFGEDNEE